MRIQIDEVTGCWNWLGHTDPLGYGRIGKEMFGDGLAHRASYRLFVGQILAGLTIDHLCRNTSCVNPAHLEMVDKRENTLRGYGPTATNHRKTHCPRGHEFDMHNTYVNPTNGQRRCRKCHTARERERRLAKAQA